jgi:hypothetical protein
MLAVGFFHVDCAVTLQRLYCFFVIEVGSRYVHVTASPDGLWTCGVPKPRHDLWPAVFLGQAVIFTPPLPARRSSSRGQ